MKKIIQLLFHRVTFIAVSILLQFSLLVGMILRFNEYFVFFYGSSVLLSAMIVLEIINNRDNPAYKIAWLIPVLIMPVFGGLVYLVFGHSGLTRRQKEAMIQTMAQLRELPRNEEVQDELEEMSHTAATQSRYITNYAFSPPSRNTETRYLPLGEIAYEEMLGALESAQQYIFLEYFIIQPGVMWNTILEILKRKAAQGVDVRVIYDDMGCMFTLPFRYDKTLESMGIRCSVFNPFRPVLNSSFNNRSHRKIAVIDGHTAFTGGINLADEYINAIEKHGHWKDTAILVRGEAAWYMTASFLLMWSHLRGVQEELEAYRPSPVGDLSHCAGFVQPFSDSPLDNEPVGESIYMNLIYKADRYVYITTPYLIVDNEMVVALCTAAKCGVDVRIITPHVADKWYVHAVTRHSYAQLLESGVRIYEYTPGFIHAKSIVVDDTYAVVSTVNLDYRSLYLHFENGVWLYGTDSVNEIYADFINTQKLSEQVTLDQAQSVPLPVRLGRAVLSVFAPLM